MSPTNLQISANSVKAYVDDFLCKPGSSRGCLASLIESNDPDAKQLNAAAFSALFIPLITAGKRTSEDGPNHSN